MEQLKHFTHEHLLSLVQFQSYLNKEKSDKEDEDEDDDENGNTDDFVVDNYNVGTCAMCLEEIYSFHLSYYSCNDCHYSLHKFCAQLPTIEENHPLHPGHKLTLSMEWQLKDPDFKFRDTQWICNICNLYRSKFYNYHCSICNINMDIICATIAEQKMDHPGHPHQLRRDFNQMISRCNACGQKHSGTFYFCTTCFCFRIHLECALLPPKILIQRFTNERFSHSHPLTLCYSFPYVEIKAKFFPRCRVCNKGFATFRWLYKCNKCQYYTHVDCATSRTEAFISSILLPSGLGKIYKNFKDDDHPNLIRCPFPDESCNLVKHHFFDKEKFNSQGNTNNVEMFSHSSHQHMLILFDTQASVINKSVCLHDPMKKVQLLCDGCVRPITDVPFYKCSQRHCDFALHEWCSRLPSEIKNHHNHPLFLLPKIPRKLLFICKICQLPSNGFAYGCKQCDYYVDVNCGFIPDVITHEAHLEHLLIKTKASTDLSEKYCKACPYSMKEHMGFYCPTCDFYLHIECALLLPKTIRHKLDKHALSLRYTPAENHSNAYFCEICEDEFDPNEWFYHCSTCAYSMHTACAPLILQCELFMQSQCRYSVFWFLNVKFGKRYKIRNHRHIVTFAQGIDADGPCDVCHKPLQFKTIFKCFECKLTIHRWCAKLNLSNLHDLP